MSAALESAEPPLRFEATPPADASAAWGVWALRQGVTAVTAGAGAGLDERGVIAALADGDRALRVALADTHAADAPLRPLLQLCTTLAADIAASTSPADIALLDSRGRGAALAEQLRQAQISFTPLDGALPLAGAHRLVLIPAALQLNSASCAALGNQAAVIGDAALARLTGLPLLPADIQAELLGEMAEERGGVARYAWAEGDAPLLTVRHGPHFSYLFMINDHPVPYSGLLGYRSVHGEILHVHVQLAAGRAGMLVLREDQVVGAAIGGAPGRSSWLVRGAQTSATFDGGSGGIVPVGQTVRCYANAAGYFQIRRAEGWRNVRISRVLRDGTVSVQPLPIDGHNALLRYLIADERGLTDYYELAA